MYPNPAKESFTVKFDENLPQTEDLQVINSLGQILKSQIIEEGISTIYISIESIPTGIYFIKIGGQKTSLLKVLK